MEQLSLTGIIMNTTNYSESSKIINVFTKELGMISLLAKGCRRLKSPLCSVCSPLLYASFQVIYKKGKVSTLTEIDIINPFLNILSDLTKVSFASYILDLVNQVLRESKDNMIFPKLLKTLELIENNLSPYALTLILQLQLLEYLGVKPVLNGCAKCGDANVITLDSYSGGYICKNCYTNERVVSPKTLKLIKMFQSVDLTNLTKLEVNDKILKEIDIFINEYYEHFTGIYIKSKKFLNTIKQLGSDK